LDFRCGVSNTICNQTTKDVSNAVTDEPCCLAEERAKSVC
jgi:hypothetical protein